MKREEIIESIKKIEKISNEVVQTKEKIKDEELEKYFCKLEKVRMYMYDAVMQENLWREFMENEVTEFIDYDYKAKVEDDILKYIFQKKFYQSKRVQIILGKRITNNIARITRKYERLFYDKFTITIIKIYDDGKIWDVDNRNVKPIQDGLIHGKIIKDDNIYCSCYMVQGYYSDKPYAEVYVISADEITKIINKKIR